MVPVAAVSAEVQVYAQLVAEPVINSIIILLTFFVPLFHWSDAAIPLKRWYESIDMTVQNHCNNTTKPMEWERKSTETAASDQ